MKRYDRTELLDRAVDLFHRQGSNGTSTAELVTELGVNRKSMYAEFGSKQQLFEAALDHYNAKHLSAVLAPVEAPDAGPDAIRQRSTGSPRPANIGPRTGLPALQHRRRTSSLRPRQRTPCRRLPGTTHHRFPPRPQQRPTDRRDQTRHQYRRPRSVLHHGPHGVAACARAEAHPEQIHAACRVATSMLDAHRPNQSLRAAR